MTLSHMFQATLNLSCVMKKKIPACGFAPQNRNGGNSGRMLAFAIKDKNRITESMHTTSPREEERLEATDPFCSSQFAEYNEH